jgi:hypothetical protein
VPVFKVAGRMFTLVPLGTENRAARNERETPCDPNVA